MDYCRRDPKQLSPYVEQTEVEGNLKGILDEKDAEICINTFNSWKNSNLYKNPINFILIEEDNNRKKKCELQSKALGLRVINVDDNENKIDLLGSQIIIGSPKKLLKLEHYIPMDLEVVIILSNNEIDDLFVHFCNRFWLESHYDYLDNEFRPKLEFKEYFEGSIKNLLITSSTKNTLLNKLTEIINEANKKIAISTFGILDDNEIFDLLLKKLKMGVEVIILTRPEEKTMQSLLKLKKAGAKIFGHPLIHAKICMAISNNSINAIMMTVNFEELGLNTGFETGVFINDDRKDSIEKVINTWIEHFPFKLETHLSLKDLNGLIINWNGEKGVLEEYSIIESKEITLKDKISKNFQDFIEYQIQDEDYHIDNIGKEIFLNYIIKRIILPTLLPKNSREINFDSLEKENKNLLKNTGLKIYKKDKKNFSDLSDY